MDKLKRSTSVQGLTNNLQIMDKTFRTRLNETFTKMARGGVGVVVGSSSGAGTGGSTIVPSNSTNAPGPSAPIQLSSTPSSAGEPLPPPEPQGELIRVFLPDGSYQGLRVGPLTTAKEVCNNMVQKLNTTAVEPEFLAKYSYNLFEEIPSKSREIQLEDDTRVLEIQKRWLKKKLRIGNRFLFKSPKGDPLPREAIVVEALRAIESPINYIERTLKEFLDVEEIKGSHVEVQLRSVLEVITSGVNLYQIDHSKVIAGETNLITRSWFLSEFGGKKAQSAESATDHVDSIPELIPGTPDQEVLEQWGFDVFQYPPPQLLEYGYIMMRRFGLIQHFKISEQKLKNFFIAVSKTYNDNPYHNFHHAFDVLQTSYSFMTTMGLSKYLTHLDLFALFVACICHDMKHPGFNNAFQVNARTWLALRYNDFSVLEMYHSAETFKLIRKPENDIIESLTREEKIEFRKKVINMILMTDLAHHLEFITKLKQRINSGTPMNRANVEDRSTVITLILKCSDISNIAKPWPISQVWADRITEEAYAQGDLEEKMKLPVALFMDRKKSDQAKNTAGFIDFVAGPIFNHLAACLPETNICVDQIKRNRNQWEKLIKSRTDAPPPSSSASTPSSSTPATPATTPSPPPPPAGSPPVAPPAGQHSTDSPPGQGGESHPPIIITTPPPPPPLPPTSRPGTLKTVGSTTLTLDSSGTDADSEALSTSLSSSTNTQTAATPPTPTLLHKKK